MEQCRLIINHLFSFNTFPSYVQIPKTPPYYITKSILLYQYLGGHNTVIETPSSTWSHEYCRGK